MKTVNPEQTFSSLLAEAAERSRKIKLLAETFLSAMPSQEYGGLVLKKSSCDFWCVVGKDPSEVGRWRYYICDRCGFMSHSTHDDPFSTILAAVEEGFVELSDEKTIERLSATEEWKIGSLRTGLIMELNSRKITFHEFQEKLSRILAEAKQC